MGIITAAAVIPLVSTAFTGIFWLGLSGVLFVAAITSLVARSGYE